MSLVAIGLSHKSSPLELREQLSLTEENFAVLCQQLPRLTAPDSGQPLLLESAVISTCNRLEFYGLSDTPDQACHGLIETLGQSGHLTGLDLRPYLYQLQGQAVVEHLMRVATGLDSLVLGEPQILGQVVAAHRRAKTQQTTRQALTRLFELAIRAGKRARTETGISTNAASVSSIAVQLARSHLGSLDSRVVAVLGAGKMSALTVQALMHQGVRQILIASRRQTSAQSLAEQWQLAFQTVLDPAPPLEPMTLDRLPEILLMADVIIASTAAPHPVLDCPPVVNAMAQRPDRPLFIVDIALPRDVEPSVGDVPGVHLYNIDDLQAQVNENMLMRAGEVPKVEQIIAAETEAFMEWYRSRSVVPTITAFRSEFEAIKAQELERTLKRLNHLDEDDQELVAELAHRLVNKFLHRPTVQLKQAAVQGDGAVITHSLHELFELELNQP